MEAREPAPLGAGLHGLTRYHNWRLQPLRLLWQSHTCRHDVAWTRVSLQQRSGMLAFTGPSPDQKIQRTGKLCTLQTSAEANSYQEGASPEVPVASEVSCLYTHVCVHPLVRLPIFSLAISLFIEQDYLTQGSCLPVKH